MERKLKGKAVNAGSVYKCKDFDALKAVIIKENINSVITMNGLTVVDMIQMKLDI